MAFILGLYNCDSHERDSRWWGCSQQADGDECWRRQNRSKATDRQRKWRQRSAGSLRQAKERRAKDLQSAKPARREAPWRLVTLIA